MKQIRVVKAHTVEVKPFYLDNFIATKQTNSAISKVTKKALRTLADDLGLVYDEKQITFTKKLLTALMKDTKHENRKA